MSARVPFKDILNDLIALEEDFRQSLQANNKEPLPRYSSVHSILSEESVSFSDQEIDVIANCVATAKGKLRALVIDEITLKLPGRTPG